MVLGQKVLDVTDIFGNRIVTTTHSVDTLGLHCLLSARVYYSVVVFGYGVGRRSAKIVYFAVALDYGEVLSTENFEASEMNSQHSAEDILFFGSRCLPSVGAFLI